MAATNCCLVRPDTYRDSVELMRVAALIEKLPGVSRAALMMATPANRELLGSARLLDAKGASAGPNDLVVAVAAADPAAADRALGEAARLLDEQAAVAAPAGEAPSPLSIGQAVAEMPRANLAIISTPGAYATAEALKAIKRGLHAFIFSDNVPVDDEVELKRLAAKKKLLVMGPDCGTAILDGVPLGFANAVRRGRIGLVGASGTGLQQVSCLIDRLGEGCSQVIGVGGHDLDERVGGLMMQAGIERLAADPGTRVIVLISKPPAPIVARRVLEVAGNDDEKERRIGIGRTKRTRGRERSADALHQDRTLALRHPDQALQPQQSLAECAGEIVEPRRKIGIGDIACWPGETQHDPRMRAGQIRADLAQRRSRCERSQVKSTSPQSSRAPHTQAASTPAPQPPPAPPAARARSATAAPPAKTA